MNLPKAIELGKEAERSLREHKFYDHADAVKVLIGGGERILAWRNDNDEDLLWNLPGETED